MRLLKRIPQKWRYLAIATASGASSIGGVLWAAFAQCPANGGRGGAIGTTIAFVSLFVRPDQGMAILEFVESRSQGDQRTPEALKRRLDAIIAGLRVNSDGQRVQNWVIAIASALGTLCWGFGDVFAQRLMLLLQHSIH